MADLGDKNEWENLVQKHLARLHSEKRKKYGKLIGIFNQKNFEEVLEVIQRRAHSRKTTRFFERLEAPLQRLQSFSLAINTLVSVEPNPSAIIWGSIQALITCALTYSSTFSTLSELLTDLTATMPRFDRYIDLLQQNEKLRGYLRELYDKYVGVCVDALILYDDCRWWKTLNVMFKPIKEAFERAKQDVAIITRKFEQEARVKIDEHVVTGIDFIKAKLSHRLECFNCPDKIFAVPYCQNDFFVGREKELKDIDTKLTASNEDGSQKRNVCIVYSMGGVGKTQLAIQYAHSFRSQYEYIFWLAAEEETTLSKDFASIARLTDRSSLDSSEPTSLPKEILKAKRWLEEIPQRWLLVYDNFENWSISKHYWPSCTHGSILITTQHSEISQIPSHPPLELKELGLRDGAKLLLTHLHRWENGNAPSEDVRKAKEISEVLGGLPVAIAHMAGYIHQTQSSLVEFSQMYKLRQGTQKIWNTSSCGPTYQYSLRLTTVWELALNQLPPEARWLINVLSMLSPDRIPEDMIFRKADKNIFKSKDLLISLRDRQLVNRELIAGQGFWSIHRSLQLHLLHLMDAEPFARQKAFEEALNAVRKAYPRQSDIQAPSNDNWALEEAYLPHAVHLQHIYETTYASPPGVSITPTQTFAHLLGDVGNYMWERALYEKGIASLELAENIYESQNWNDLIEHSKVSTILGVMSQEIGISGRQRGLDRCKKSLALRKQHFANLQRQNKIASLEDTLLFANAFNDVACSLIEYGSYLQAESFLEESLTIKAALNLTEDGQAFFNYAENYKNMALVRLAQNRGADALRLAKKAVALMESGAGVQAATTHSFLFHLANVLFCVGEYQAALRGHEHVRIARAKIFGEEEVHSLHSYYACGIAYRAVGIWKMHGKSL